MNDWEKKIQKRKDNIGFLTRVNGFIDPTGEKLTSAFYAEVDSWQKTKGTKPYKISNEYSVSLGAGINLKSTEHLVSPRLEMALKAFIETPMDKTGELKAVGIDVEPYRWREIGIVKAVWSWIRGRKVRRKYD